MMDLEIFSEYIIPSIEVGRDTCPVLGSPERDSSQVFSQCDNTFSADWPSRAWEEFEGPKPVCLCWAAGARRRAGLLSGLDWC